MTCAPELEKAVCERIADIVSAFETHEDEGLTIDAAMAVSAGTDKSALMINAGGFIFRLNIKCLGERP